VGGYAIGSGITSITIPEGVTDIHEGAFSDCKNLTSVTLPRSLQRVGSSAFRDCTSLVNVTIPSGHTIQYGFYEGADFVADGGKDNLGRGKKAFKGCSSLSAASRQAIEDSGYIGEF
jgi:hypothetical protein